MAMACHLNVSCKSKVQVAWQCSLKVCRFRPVVIQIKYFYGWTVTNEPK